MLTFKSEHVGVIRNPKYSSEFFHKRKKSSQDDNLDYIMRNAPNSQFLKTRKENLAKKKRAFDLSCNWVCVSVRRDSELFSFLFFYFYSLSALSVFPRVLYNNKKRKSGSHQVTVLVDAF